MDIIVVIWFCLLSLVVIFVASEYFIGNVLKDENPIKKWWRKNIITMWDNNNPKLQLKKKSYVRLGRSFSGITQRCVGS